MRLKEAPFDFDMCPLRTSCPLSTGPHRWTRIGGGGSGCNEHGVGGGGEDLGQLPESRVAVGQGTCEVTVVTVESPVSLTGLSLRL